MKQLLVLGLVMIYSVSAVGVPLHFHYCKGDLEHISLLFQKECSDHDEESKRIGESPFACCLKGKVSCESSNEKGDCCDDETELLQLDEDAVQPLVDVKSLMAVVAFPQVTEHAVYGEETVIEPRAHSPPDTGPPIYVLNCSFVFYG